MTYNSKTWVVLLIVVCGLAYLVALGPNTTQLSYRVDWVVDGDTLIVNDTRVRIANIDAPELGSSWGESAKRTMIDVAYGKEVHLDCNGRDKYDRLLCHVFIDGVDLGEYMVARGLAREWR